MTARISWRPKIKPWGPGIFEPVDPLGLHLDVEVRASAGAPPAVDVLAELADFDLNLIGSGGGLIQLKFRRIAFHAGSADDATPGLHRRGPGLKSKTSY